MMTRLFLPTLLLSGGLFACGDEMPSHTDYDDVAQTVSGLVFDEGGDAELADDAAEASKGELDGRFRADHQGTHTGDRGTLAYTYDIECRTARGEVIAPCDVRTRTASVAVRVEGELDTDRRQGALLRTASWSLAWDGQTTVQIDGRASTDVASSFRALRRAETRHYMMTAEGTYSGLELDLSARRFVAGRIELSIDAERTRSTRFRDVEASFTVDAVVELTSDGPALITLDGERTYEADPVTGQVDPES